MLTTAFERDLRLWADKKKGCARIADAIKHVHELMLTRSRVDRMKFDSGGLWMRATSKEVLVNTEREIFEVLDLDYIRKELDQACFAATANARLATPTAPEWRNCDV